MMRMRLGITLRNALMIMLPSTTTASTLMLITSALDIFTVIARAEQIPSTCTVIGLLSFKRIGDQLPVLLAEEPFRGFRLRCFDVCAHPAYRAAVGLVVVFK